MSNNQPEIRVVRARFDKDIDQWLRLFAGDQYERLCDWMATVPRWEDQNWLCLSGRHGKGKELLVKGLARLWGRQGPCVRVISRNDANVLMFGDSITTVPDIEAGGGRIFYMTARTEAEEWLEVHNRDGAIAHAWVEGDYLAEHCQYLANTRESAAPHDDPLDKIRESAAPHDDPLARESAAPHDLVNHPNHYTQHSMECIDVLRVILTPEEFRGFLLGNMLKYRWRADHKGQREQDLAKAAWYQKALAALEERS